MGIVGEPFGAAFALECEKPRGDTVQQPPVVRHKDERSGKFQQALLEHVERGNIQIVRRLVQEQEIGRLEHQAGDEQAGLFPAGQTGDW